MKETRVHYRSTVRGHAEEPGRTPPQHFYCGFMRQIKNVDADLIASAVEIKKYLGPRRLADGTLAEPVPGVDIERYEVFDIENDDILVFWRVPMRLVKDSPAKS